MDFRVLGTIEVAGPSPSSSPPGAKERAILARLLLDAGRTVPADALLEAAWDGVPREVAARSLAVRVANLRTFLEPGRDRGAPSSLLVRDGPGYRLAVTPEQVDAHRFERCVSAAAALPADAALDAYDDALALWRGPPFGDLGRGGVRAGRDPPARGPPQPGRGGARPRARRARPAARGGARAAPAGRRRPAARGAGLHADARPLRRGPAGRGARGLPRPGARGCASSGSRPARARARSSAGSSSTTRRSPRRRRRPSPASPRAAPRRPAPVGREPQLARLRAALRRGRRRPAHRRDDARRARRREEHAGRRVPAGVGRARRRRPVPRPPRPGRAVHAGARGARRAGPRPGRATTVVAALAQRAPTWLVELPWLLDERPRRRGGPPPRPGRDARADAARDARGARRDRRRRRRSCSCSRTCTGPTTPRSTCSPRVLRRRDPARLLVLGTFRPVAGDGAPPVAALVNDLSVRGLVEELPVPRLPADAVAAYLEARFPAAPAARRAGRRARAAHRRQPAVHAQPARPLARGRARWPSAAAPSS